MSESNPLSHHIDWLAPQFDGFEKTLIGETAGSFHDVRKDAFKAANELGIPTTKNEEWRYTNVAALARSSFHLASRENESSLNADDIRRFLIPDLPGSKMVFIDGHFSPRLSMLEEVTSGVTIGTLRGLLAGVGSEQDLQAKRKHFTKYASFKTDPFVALNTTFTVDGAFIRVQRNVTLENPIQLYFISTGPDRETASYPRVLIIAEENSSLKVVETYNSASSKPYFTGAVSEVVLEQNARVEHTKVQREGSQAISIGILNVHQAQSSSFTSNVFHFGGKLVRNEINPVLAGEGCETLLNGLSAISGTQHVDNHTVIDHAKPNCFSREEYKGVYDGHSAGVFNGTIIVREDARKTNAIQSNQSILLSSTATIDTKPQLKIWADDVKCTHGATVGQLDDHALFYLQSRGIDKEAARKILIHAFASDVVYHVQNTTLRDYLEHLLEQNLNASMAG